MDFPEVVVPSRSILCQFGAPASFLVSNEWAMPIDVTHPFSKSIPQGDDHFVDRMTVRTGIAAVLDQGHFGLRASQHVVVARIDRRIEPIFFQLVLRIEYSGPIIIRGMSALARELFDSLTLFV